MKHPEGCLQFYLSTALCMLYNILPSKKQTRHGVFFFCNGAAAAATCDRRDPSHRKNVSDDGLIQQSDLREVMKACMEENGMNFDEKEVEGLAQALNEDAAGLAAGEEAENCPGITVDDLKAELAKHDGLLENLSIR